MSLSKRKIVLGIIGLIQIICFVIFATLMITSEPSNSSGVLPNGVAPLFIFWGAVMLIKILFIDWQSDWRKNFVNIVEIPVGPAMIVIGVLGTI